MLGAVCSNFKEEVQSLDGALGTVWKGLYTSGYNRPPKALFGFHLGVVNFVLVLNPRPFLNKCSCVHELCSSQLTML